MKIKILHISSTRYGIGGVERLLLDMSDKYDFSEFEISYCNLFCDKKGEGVFPSALTRRGLEHFDIKGNSWHQIPQVLVNLVKLIKREKFDIVHTHMLQATIIGQTAAKIAKFPQRVLTKHYTGEMVAHNDLIKATDLRLTKTADGIISISESVKNDMLGQGVPESKISIIHNGIDLSAFDNLSEEAAAPLAGENDFIIGTVGSLTKRKGHEHLIRAMPSILEKHPEARLLIIGEGPEEESLRNLINQLNLQEKITLTGFQKNVSSLLMSLDLYVHPSINEPFGIAILEAMAAKKCVVATNVEGIPEIVADNKTGFLVSPSSPDELSSTICKAIENYAETEKMGERGRKRVEENFSIEKTVEAYQSLYKNIISKQ